MVMFKYWSNYSNYFSYSKVTSFSNIYFDWFKGRWTLTQQKNKHLSFLSRLFFLSLSIASNPWFFFLLVACFLWLLALYLFFNNIFKTLLWSYNMNFPASFFVLFSPISHSMLSINGFFWFIVILFVHLLESYYICCNWVSMIALILQSFAWEYLKYFKKAFS
jgi:hypothetical protein